jgi:hypothetical protein
VPKLFDLALFVREYEDEVRAAFPPAPIVKATMAPLAWIAKQRGLADRYMKPVLRAAPAISSSRSATTKREVDFSKEPTMLRLSSIPDKLSGRAAALAGAAFVASGVTQIVHSQRHTGNRVVGVAGYLALSFFIVALISAAPSFLALTRRAQPGAATKAAVAAAFGTAVLGLTSITSIVNGHDLGLFNVVAPLTNGAWLLKSIILAVSLKRAGKVPTAIAVGLPITWAAAIPLASVGGGVIAGAYYFTVGHLLVNHAVDATVGASPRVANA